MVEEKFSPREIIFEKLLELARKGPIPAISRGDPAVGMTLLDALEIEYTSAAKPNYHGIVISAHRSIPAGARNRVNLFAQVPDWRMSYCKSSREIIERYGYDTGPYKRHLVCTVNSRQANSQGLMLSIDRDKSLLNEIAVLAGRHEPVATWQVSKLENRLIESHPESFWVKANVLERDGQELFHYREVVYTGPPKVDMFLVLLDSGTITMDHLIEINHGRVKEKGPLFKINPSNLELLFPAPMKYDLLSL